MEVADIPQDIAQMMSLDQSHVERVSTQDISQITNLDQSHVERVVNKLNNQVEAINAAIEEYLNNGTGVFVEGKQEDGWVERRKDKSRKVRYPPVTLGNIVCFT